MSPYFFDKNPSEVSTPRASILEKALSEPMDAGKLEKLASSQFALPEQRLLPFHTSELTLKSYANLQDNLEKIAAYGVDVQELEDRLLTAAVAHGCYEEAMQLRDDFPSREGLSKTASSHELDNSLDCLVGGFSALIPDHDRPSLTPEQILKEAEALETGLKYLSPDEARQASLHLMKHAAAAGVDTEQFTQIEAYSGVRGTDLEKTAELMLFRAKRAQDPLLKKAMARLAQTVLILDEHEMNLEKVANFIDRFDSVVGTDRLVRRGSLPDGFNSVFNKPLIEKVAGVELAGKEFTEEQLKSLPVEKWAQALGDEFVKSATSNGEFDYSQAIDIASTLPLPEAKSLSLFLEGN